MAICGAQGKHTCCRSMLWLPTIHCPHDVGIKLLIPWHETSYEYCKGAICLQSAAGANASLSLPCFTMVSHPCILKWCTAQTSKACHPNILLMLPELLSPSPKRFVSQLSTYHLYISVLTASLYKLLTAHHAGCSIVHCQQTTSKTVFDKHLQLKIYKCCNITYSK